MFIEYFHKYVQRYKIVQVYDENIIEDLFCIDLLKFNYVNFLFFLKNSSRLLCN